MSGHFTADNCMEFSRYAGKSLLRWKLLEGCEVCFDRQAIGIVRSIEPTQKDDVFSISVQYYSEHNWESITHHKSSLMSTGKLSMSQSVAEIYWEQKCLGTPTSEIVSDETRIRDLCRKRDIRTLCHFTRISNLSSILRFGLRSRNALNQSQISFEYTDPERWDGHREANCLSIEFPNYPMLQAKAGHRLDEWVILHFVSDILWAYECGFYETNASSNSVRHDAFAHHKGINALRSMFRDSEYRSRGDNQLRCCDPTDEQAEVLIIDAVPMTYLEHVSFYDTYSKEQWKNANPEYVQQVECVNEQCYFGYRSQYLSGFSNAAMKD